MLKDGRGQLVRKFADTKGTNRVDTFSYYLDGVEVYREVDTNGNRVPDQFRWFGSGCHTGAVRVKNWPPARPFALPRPGAVG